MGHEQPKIVVLDLPKLPNEVSKNLIKSYQLSCYPLTSFTTDLHPYLPCFSPFFIPTLSSRYSVQGLAHFWSDDISFLLIKFLHIFGKFSQRRAASSYSKVRIVEKLSKRGKMSQQKWRKHKTMLMLTKKGKMLIINLTEEERPEGI